MDKKMVKRIIMSAGSVIVCGISVGMFKHAALGVDPFQALMSGLDAVIPIDFGTLYVITNVVLLLFALIFDRKKIGLATVINLTLLGYVAQFSQSFFAKLLADPNLVVRVALLLVAVVIMCFASSLYFTADLGVSTYDAISLVISEKQSKVAFKWCRVISDLICVILGAVLIISGGYGMEGLLANVGVGTIITAFFMGPLIEFFRAKVAVKILEG